MGKQVLLLLFVTTAFSDAAIAQSNAIKHRAVLIQGATFEMGLTADDIAELMQKFAVKRPEIFQDSRPKHRVTIGSFFLDKTEVTNEQFRRFVLKNRQWQKDHISPKLHNGKYLERWNGNEFPKGEAKFPVTNITWHSAVAYCRSVGMRLPTEAEWEYAARGGNENALFPWGSDQPDQAKVNYGKSEIGRPVAAGQYPPNPFGLYDMAGNVWEFLADEFQPYSSAAAIDPVGGGLLFASGSSYLAVTTRRSLRGGSYGASLVNLLVVYRDSHLPSNAVDHVGFRCAVTAEKQR